MTATVPTHPRREALVAAVRAGSVKRILAARFARLGDVVFTTPALDVLAERLPGARIDYLTSGAGHDLVAHHPAVAEVLRFEVGWQRPLQRSRRAELVREIRGRGYDLMLIFESDQPTRDMLGTRVGLFRDDGPPRWRRVRSDGSYASANDPRVLVGLGPSVHVTAVRAVWPGDRTEEWTDVPVDQWTTLHEGTGRTVHP